MRCSFVIFLTIVFTLLSGSLVHPFLCAPPPSCFLSRSLLYVTSTFEDLKNESLNDRELNFILKKIRNQRREEDLIKSPLRRSNEPLKLLFETAIGLSPSRWSYDVNLNLLLSIFFRENEPFLAVNLLLQLDAPPPRSCVFALRECLTLCRNIEAAESIYSSSLSRLRESGNNASLPVVLHTLYLPSLLKQIGLNGTSSDKAAAILTRNLRREGVNEEVARSVLRSLLEGHYETSRYDLLVETYSLLRKYQVHELSLRDNEDPKPFNLYLASAKEVITTALLAGSAEQADLMWEQVKTFFITRTSSGEALDAVSLGTAIDMAASMRDFLFATTVFHLREQCRQDDSGGSHNAYERVMHAYLRCHVEPRQSASLKDVINVELLPVSSKSSASSSLSSRSIDEMVNAYLRVMGLPLTLEDLLPKLRRRRPGQRHLSKLSRVSAGNALIAFERYWRDWDSVEQLDERGYAGRNLAEESSALMQRVISIELVEHWAVVLATLLARGAHSDALTLLLTLSKTTAAAVQSQPSFSSSPQFIARVLELAVFSAVDGSIPLITSGASHALAALPREGRLSSVLAVFPSNLRLLAAPKRITCSLAEVITFLQLCSQPENQLPIGISLLQNIFEDAIHSRRNKQASEVLLVLRRSRLVMDLTRPQQQSILPGNDQQSEEIRSFSTSVNAARAVLARKWVAQLLGTSLNRVQSSIADSLQTVLNSKIHSAISPSTTTLNSADKDAVDVLHDGSDPVLGINSQN